MDERESNERVSLISFCEDRIVLGRRLNNPYSLSNMKTALSEVLATKSIAGTVPATLEANWLLCTLSSQRWQYTRVRLDSEFPEGLRYEIIEECYIPEDSESTKSGGDDLGYLFGTN